MPAWGLVVNDRNEILLIQRGFGKEKGKWSLPGGMRDKGESYKRTAVRETREETGIKMSADWLYIESKSHRFEIWRRKTHRRTLEVSTEGVLGREVVSERYAAP